MIPTNPYVLLGGLAATLAIAAASFYGGYRVSDQAWEAKWAQDKLQTAQATAKVFQGMVDERDRLTESLARANDEHTRRLQKAKQATNLLRDQLRAGTHGLRVNATCPDPLTLPDTAAGAAVDTGASPRLTANAERDYFALRDGIDQVKGQLAACQNELRSRVR